MGQTRTWCILLAVTCLGSLGLVTKGDVTTAPDSSTTVEQSPPDQQGGRWFIGGTASNIFYYDSDLKGSLNLDPNSAEGWGYGGVVGRVNPNASSWMLRLENYPDITVSGDNSAGDPELKLSMTRWDAEASFFAPISESNAAVKWTFELGLKYTNVKDEWTLGGLKEDRTENWYMVPLGLGASWRIGGNRSPVGLYGAIRGLIGVATVNGGADGDKSGLGYGWGGAAGVRVFLFNDSGILTAGYRIQQLEGSGTDEDTGDEFTVASDRLQGFFVQATVRF